MPSTKKNAARRNQSRSQIGGMTVMRTEAPLVQGLDDLSHEKIAIEKDYIVAQELRSKYPHLKTIEFVTTPQALEAVATGKADAYVGALAVATHLINRQAMGNLKIAAPTSLYDQSLRFGVRSDWPELAGLLNAGLASLKQEDHDAIRQRSRSSAVADADRAAVR